MVLPFKSRKSSVGERNEIQCNSRALLNIVGGKGAISNIKYISFIVIISNILGIKEEVRRVVFH